MPEPARESKSVEVAYTVKGRGRAIGDKVKVTKSEAERLEAAHLAKRTAKSAT